MSILKVDTLQNSVGENLVFGNKNLLINGSQSVWQRSTSESVSTDTYSTVDRFKTRVGAMGAFTISRSTDVPSGQGFGYSTKWDCTTADASPAAGDFIIFEQRMEGQNLQHLLKGTSSAKAVTVSFWVKSNKTGTYIVEMRDIDNLRTISKSYTINSASTWEKKEITFDGDTTGTLDNDNNDSLYLQMWLGAGSTYSSGTLNTSWSSDTSANRAVGQVNLADSTSNEWYITGVQLEVGSKATDFEFEPYDRIVSRCYRYYYQIGGESIYERVGGAYVSSSTLAYADFPHPVVMRAIPSYSFSSVGHFAIAEPNARTCTAISNSHSTTFVGSVGCTISGATGGRGGAFIVNNNTSARFKVDAEL